VRVDEKIIMVKLEEKKENSNKNLKTHNNKRSKQTNRKND
jgi:hypothetical protein